MTSQDLQFECTYVQASLWFRLTAIAFVLVNCAGIYSAYFHSRLFANTEATQRDNAVPCLYCGQAAQERQLESITYFRRSQRRTVGRPQHGIWLCDDCVAYMEKEKFSQVPDRNEWRKYTWSYLFSRHALWSSVATGLAIIIAAFGMSTISTESREKGRLTTDDTLPCVFGLILCLFLTLYSLLGFGISAIFGSLWWNTP